MSDKALFIGGPGTISRGAIGELVAAGWDVSVLTHPKDPVPDLGVRFLWGDRDDAAVLRAACDEVRPDVVIDTCCYTTDQVTQALDVFAAPGRQYVFVSTVDVFGYPLSRLPVRESDEHREPNSPYALAKRDCEALVNAAGAADRVAVTIIRPGYSMGPRFVIGFFSRQGGRTMLRRLQEGRPIVVPGDGSTLFQPGTGIDAGRMMARVVGEPRAHGRVFTCAGPQVISHDAYAEVMAAVVGVAPQLVHIPADLLLALDAAVVDATILDADGSILPVLTRFDLAYSSDAILELGGPFEPRVSPQEAIASHLAWLDEQGWPDTTEGPDDRLIRRFERAREAFLAPAD
jgi:nucleoside-diphosphate-sugar epimerase